MDELIGKVGPLEAVVGAREEVQGGGRYRIGAGEGRGLRRLSEGGSTRGQYRPGMVLKIGGREKSRRVNTSVKESMLEAGKSTPFD